MVMPLRGVPSLVPRASSARGMSTSAAGDLGEHGHLGDGAFQLAGVGVDDAGDEADDVLGQLEVAQAGLLADDGHAGLVARPVDLGDQAPVEPADQALLQVGDLPRAAVAGEDDLPLGLVQRVEGVEELLLGLLVGGEELDVVDHQDVRVAVAVAELVQLAALDGLDEVVDERLAAQDAQLGLGVAGGDLAAGGLEQVGLAQPDAAVDEQRVVSLAGRLADRHAGGVGQAVARAGDEGLEGVVLPQRQSLRQRGWQGGFRSGPPVAGGCVLGGMSSAVRKHTPTSRPVAAWAASVNRRVAWRRQ